MADLERTRHICAKLIVQGKEPNRKLIPLFERIEREIEKMEKEQNLLNRIHQIAKSSKYKI